MNRENPSYYAIIPANVRYDDKLYWFDCQYLSIN